MFTLDPVHASINIFSSKLSQDIWRNKYRWKDEQSIEHTFARVSKAIFPDNNELANAAYEAMRLGLWAPGGRITAGAGTSKRVTLLNCYVNGTVDDSMEGILHAHSNTMLTLQQGGGIGTDFSTLRPEGAVLNRTHTKASGPIPFMHMWDAGSRTIRSAGERRGAMMGTICDTHPDLLKFIKAKQVKGALEQFNVSILVSDALMEAVRDGDEWALYFPVLPVDRATGLEALDFVDDNGILQHVYQVCKARELWDEITKATYEFSEPGVIFIDRVNEQNNLWYCENIRCTNPCGEQPLPPYGDCNLGHVNLARLITRPFTEHAAIDWVTLECVVRMGVRFLDNVIDTTIYPLPEQEAEAKAKRRIGIGFTGLANALAMLGERYGSPRSADLTVAFAERMTLAAYDESVVLAREYGPFPAFDADKYLNGNGSSFASTLPHSLKKLISEHGIRNSHLTTIAPVGTGSAFYGNPSSGCEPVFAFKQERKMLKPSQGFKDEWETYEEWDYGAAVYRSIHTPADTFPGYMVESGDLTVHDHIVIQAAAQRWVDSSISKTVNIPEDMPYDDFVRVYDLAYQLGCKGCTTYRRNPLRGSILEAAGTSAREDGRPRERPDVLQGETYKVKWPSLNSAVYLTINNDGVGDYEIFLASKDARNSDWFTAISILVTAIYRKGGDISFVGRELQQVQSLHDTAFLNQRHHPSLPAYIGWLLEKHAVGELVQPPNNNTKPQPTGERCPNCRMMTFYRKEGCGSCTTCGYTSC